MPSSVFISHTHSDQDIAHAIRDSVQLLCREAVTIQYSTNKELDGGILPGDDWYRWIGRKVSEAKVALILLTPNSIHKPWVLWEGGAVAGAALADKGSVHGYEGEGLRKLWPITYGLRNSEIPAPFFRDQITDGLNSTDIKQMFAALLQQLSLSGQELLRAGQQIEMATESYINRVTRAMRNAPLMVTEAAVQEWLERLNVLERENRLSEIDELHDWMNIAFGRNEGSIARPLDLRIHRRLGELYSKVRRADRASQEFELARQLAPRDIYVLRQLGKAYLDQRRLDDAKEILDFIAGLDEKAFMRNAENAALKARWHRLGNDDVRAESILKNAFEQNTTSYYLADLLGQVQLALGRVDEAKTTYQRLLNEVSRLGERNIWVAASGFTAAMVVGDRSAADQFLSSLETLHVTDEQAASIFRGIMAVSKHNAVSSVDLDRLRAALGAGLT